MPTGRAELEYPQSLRTPGHLMTGTSAWPVLFSHIRGTESLRDIFHNDDSPPEGKGDIRIEDRSQESKE